MEREKMDTTFARRRSPLRFALAATAAVSIAFGGALVATAPASAAEVEEEGTLNWGFRSFFRNYVGTQLAALPVNGGALPVGERILVSDGALFDEAGVPATPSNTSTPNETLPYLFPITGGTFDSASDFDIETVGTVFYRFPSHYFDMTLANVSVVAVDGVAALYGDLAVEVYPGYSFEPGEYGGEDILLGTIGAFDVVVNEAGTSATVSGSSVALSQEASDAVLSFLSPGADLDNFSVTATLSEDEVVPEPVVPGDSEQIIDVEVPLVVAPPTEPVEPVDPADPVEPGDFSWSIDNSDGAVTLGTATAGADSFSASGELNPVNVTDGRAAGSSWSIAGSVSDFTGAGETGFDGSYLGWTPKVITPGANAVEGAAVASGFGTGGPGLSESAVLASGTSGAEGAAAVGADLELELPLDTPAGSYSATLTLTALG